MAPFDFLSQGWIAAARQVRSDHDETLAQSVPEEVRLNLVITEVPFDPGQLDAHLDTTLGRMDLETGHLDGGDATVTLDYFTARDIFIEGTPDVLMRAFMAGKLRVQGDMAKLVAAMTQLTPPEPEKAEPLRAALRDITILD
ncbi:MAG: hypothetical protein ACT4OS_02855 [Acidimicrobiales bacterium]